ncbi:restriction endonuclease subunit S [Neisseria polysaccharea]|uniref:restriction endonuclease subunit S n=1 Tax=Neisseria polysaccharea TaxID=489 RepID=UPI00131B391C
MTTEQELPKGWKKTTLGAEFEWSSGGTPKSGIPAYYENGSIHWLNISDLNDGLVSYAEKKITELGLQESSAKIVPQGAVLIAIYGSIGKLGINTIPLATNQAICFTKKIPEYILNKFLFYYLLSIRNQLITMGKGGTQQNISQTVLKGVPFFYPTSKEAQQAIVNKIESLFAEIDEGIGRLKTAAQQIQQYRQSLLKNAFNGELTKEWRSKHADTLPSENELLAQIQTTREQHHAQQLADWQTAVSQWEQNGKEGKKPSKPKAPTQAVKFEDNFADLPSGWIWGKLSDLGELARGKSKHRPRNDKKLFGGKYPFVQTGEVRAANRIIKKYEQTYSEFGLEQSKLWQKGTLCITIAANIAETAFLGFDACFPDSIVGFSASKAVLPEYIELFIKSARTRIESYAPATAQKNINLNTLENLIVPYCSLAEQTQIVAILESKLTACDQLAAELAKQLKQAELLKQAVLKAAFSGSLLDK